MNFSVALLSLQLSPKAIRGQNCNGEVSYRGPRPPPPLWSVTEGPISHGRRGQPPRASSKSPISQAGRSLKQQCDPLQPGPPLAIPKDGGAGAACSAPPCGRGASGGAVSAAGLRGGPAGDHGYGGWCCFAAAGVARLRGGVLTLLARTRGLRRRAVLRHRRCRRGFRGGGAEGGYVLKSVSGSWSSQGLASGWKFGCPDRQSVCVKAFGDFSSRCFCLALVQPSWG